VHIEIRDHHRLIKEGPYKYMRHPYYLSVMLELAGFPLIPNAYFSFLISLCFYFPLVFIRLYLEEIEMINKFGDSYNLYKNEIRGLLPIKKRKK
jgi:protein-S-isoprenylcysteine O-methyltransferase Ste14